VIDFIRQQYIENGTGRWAVIEKETNTFIGWAGLKLIKEETNHHNGYYDVGYRFIKKYWGKGYATEAADACITYGFTIMNLNEIYAIADAENTASHHVLQKIGMRFIETFHYQRTKHDWYKITKHEWLETKIKSIAD
ncbi:MAG: GNAT family N-acetyltransferase, partial [Cytophagales bacterium]|nr:GNAT family N-acetyltransferase [Cytophaga sp.]